MSAMKINNWLCAVYLGRYAPTYLPPMEAPPPPPRGGRSKTTVGSLKKNPPPLPGGGRQREREGARAREVESVRGRRGVSRNMYSPPKMSLLFLRCRRVFWRGGGGGGGARSRVASPFSWDRAITRCRNSSLSDSFRWQCYWAGGLLNQWKLRRSAYTIELPKHLIVGG